MAKCCTFSKYDKNGLLWLYNRASSLNYDMVSMKISVFIQALLPVLHLFVFRKKRSESHFKDNGKQINGRAHNI